MADVYVPPFETQTDQRVPTPWTNCTFASGAMLASWWTWGARRTDDVELRDASGIPVHLGANFAALRRAILAELRLDLRFSDWDGSGNADMTWGQLREHLARGGAAAVAGRYERLSGYRSTDGKALTRWQPGGAFGHAMFAVDYRPGDQTVRIMDPLGRGTYAGDRAPLDALWSFIFKSSWADADVLVAAAHSFAGARPARPTTAPAPPRDLAGTRSAFGTLYPSYVHTPAEALAWVNRNIRRYLESGALKL